MIERKLSGKVAVITGGARGLGRGYALRLAGLGADIAIIDRNLRAAEVYEFERAAMTAATVMAECEANGVRALGVEADLTSREVTTSAIDDIARQLGRIDIAVCNAGGGIVVFADERTPSRGTNEAGDAVTTGTPSDCPEEMLTRVLDINLKTTMYTCMAVAPHMKRQGGGRIITVSSTAGVDARGTYHPYGMQRPPSSTTRARLRRNSGPSTSTSMPSRRASSAPEGLATAPTWLA
jgi:3-oxoacyl-[acyl-carrier protein] reductase